VKRIKIALFIGILLSLSFFFARCGGKEKKTDAAFPIENSTEIVGTQRKPVTAEKSSVRKEGASAHTPVSSERLRFKKKDGSTYTLMIEGGKLLPDPQSKPILLINLFDTYEHASMAQIPYLSSLQETYGDRLTVLGIPTNQSLDEEELKAFISMQKIDYFVSYESNPETLGYLFERLLDIDGLTTPTTLLYHQGQADSVYEGAVPIEMITHDIVMINKE
jgi:hypothetical protein